MGPLGSALALFVCLLAPVLLITETWRCGPAQAAAGAAGSEPELVPPREVVQPAAEVPAWKQLWDRGRELVRNEQPVAALAVYRRLLAAEPQLMEARWELALILRHQGMLEEALPHLEQLREARTENADYNQALARTLLELGRFGRAGELFAGLLAADPDNPALLLGRVQALLGQERAGEALPHLERLARLTPGAPGLSREPFQGEVIGESLVRLYLHLDRAAMARPLVRELARPAAASPRLLELAAVVHEELGMTEAAVAYWRRLLAREPGHRLAAARQEAYLAQAAARREAYLVAEGMDEEALRHLLPRLAAQPDDPFLLNRVIDVYRELSRWAEARPHLEHYLKLYPDDREALLRLIDLYNRLELRAEALIALERLLSFDGEPVPDKLRQAALLYEERGEAEAALELYSRLLRKLPADVEIVARKLRLLAALEREPEIRAHLELPENRRLAAAILAAWHELEPADQRVILALVSLHLEEGRLAAAEELLAAQPPELLAQPEALRLRALLRERHNLPYAALQDYETLLRLVPDREPERRRALQLAARLGLAARVAAHREYLLPGAGADWELARELVAARLELGDLAGARAELAVFEEPALAAAAGVEPGLLAARFYRLAGMAPEAEQALHLALLNAYGPLDRQVGAPDERLGEGRVVAVYVALIELALAEGREADGRRWLAALEQRLRFYPHEGVTLADHEIAGMAGTADRELGPAEIRLLTESLAIRLDLAAGEQRRALRRLQSLPAAEGEVARRLIRELVGALLVADRPEVAENLLHNFLLLTARPEPEDLLLAARISEQRGWAQAGDAYLQRARQWALADPGRSQELAGLLARHGWPEAAQETLQELEVPELQPAPAQRLALIDALLAAGRPSAALAATEEALAWQPGCFSLQKRQLQLLLQLGRLEESLELNRQLAAAHPWSAAELVLPRVHALWLQRRWRPALEELETALAARVEERFARAAAAAALPVPADEPPGTWGRIKGAVNPLRAFIDTAMEPDYAAALKPADDRVWRVRRLAAPLYADYHRRQRLELEYEARRAFHRREYFAATRSFERLQRKYPDEAPLLYDLAGLYGYLERLESEAAAYRQLRAAAVAYPGLDEAEARNRRQRRPRTSLTYDYIQEEGRAGAKAIRGEYLGAVHRLTPALGHELAFAFSRRNYRKPGGREPDGGGGFRGRQFELLYRRDVFAGVDLLLGFGGHDLPESNEDRQILLGRAEIAGDFGDRFRGGISYRREAVTDTTAALAAGIRSDGIRTEGALDLLPRLEAGAAYLFRHLSDGNQTNGHDLWLTYTVFTDPTLLTVRYLYDFRDSSHGYQDDGAPAAAADPVHPYWAPLNHWRKTIEVAFRHQLDDDPLQRDLNRYYTLRYASIYDSDGYGHQQLGASFFLEWNRRLSLEAGLALSTAPVYRSREFKAGINYRW